MQRKQQNSTVQHKKKDTVKKTYEIKKCIKNNKILQCYTYSTMDKEENTLQQTNKIIQYSRQTKILQIVRSRLCVSLNPAHDYAVK